MSDLMQENRVYSDAMTEVLDVLHQKVELGADVPSGYVKALRKFSKFLCTLAISCFPILGICVAYIMQSRRPILAVAELAQLIALCQLLAALIWMALDIISIALDLARLDTRTFERRKAEMRHDFQNASELSEFEIDTLQAVDKWLSLKIDRMKMRIGIFLGGSDKVAFFALAGTGWSIWHNLPNGNWSWEKRIYLYGMGMLAGLAIGGMLMNWLIKKLTYQRDLLALVLQYKGRKIE